MPLNALVDPEALKFVNRGPTTPAEWALFAVGLTIVALTAVDLTRSLVITRWSNTPISRVVRRVVETFANVVARRFSSYHRRDAIRAWTGAFIIVGSLATWLLCFLVGYSFMMRGLISLDFGTAIREAGSSLFTLGFATVDRERLSYIDFMAAATGPITIGLMISYLPTIYSAYNTREIDVALLKSPFGEPNWGPEILARQSELGFSSDRSLAFWREWERWAVNVAESHTTYSVLIFMRSSRPMRSWSVALLSVLDAAAMTTSLQPDSNHAAVRVFLRQGIECVHDLASVLRLKEEKIHSGDSPINLTKEEFLQACQMLSDRGLTFERSPQEAWPFFRDWRRMYERQLYEMTRKLDAVPAYWSGPRSPVTPEVAPTRRFYDVSSDGGLTYPIDAPEPKRHRRKRQLG